MYNQGFTHDLKSYAPLEDQLTAYSATTESRVDPKDFSDWTRRLPLYAAAVGSALAFTTSAQAGVIYSGVQNVTATDPAFAGAAIGASQVLTIDGASFNIHVGQFKRNGFHYGVAGIDAHGANQIEELPNPIYGINLAKKFSSGNNISTGQLFGGYAYLHFQSSTSPRGQFAPGQVGFAGIKIGSGAAERLGWIRLSFKNTAGGYPSSITAIDWAYNSAAGSIKAGDEGSSSATPEPGTAALALLALGSAGVLAWRKRRHDVAAQTS